jgi:hypothetical protein
MTREWRDPRVREPDDDRRSLWESERPREDETWPYQAGPSRGREHAMVHRAKDEGGAAKPDERLPFTE